MSDSTEQWLLEIRLFTLKPGVREEFHRVSRDGTIPLMRKCGITVLSHGPTENDENGYLLMRAFRSEEERVELSQSVYATEEWGRNYEEPVMGMMADYHTAVIPVPRGLIDEFAARMAAA